ncbi:uncharacterized protein L201_001814 [Kwoniella dendrophila CBS 6074]|uniref:F-box domain-containing protein n=1 Tax=Kwoniella dendrophila CBS 6074 TaxID=1295534 RepID=A0AAX4JQD1_9TREE
MTDNLTTDANDLQLMDSPFNNAFGSENQHEKLEQSSSEIPFVNLKHDAATSNDLTMPLITFGAEIPDNDQPDRTTPHILNTDIMKNIFGFCDRSSLYNILQTSRLMYNMVIPILYEAICLDCADPEKFPLNLCTCMEYDYELAIMELEWGKLNPKNYVKRLLIYEHFSHKHLPFNELPNLIEIQIVIREHKTRRNKGIFWWSFCSDSNHSNSSLNNNDNENKNNEKSKIKSCNLIKNLQPKEITIFDVTNLNSPSPFLLPSKIITTTNSKEGDKFWSKLSRITIVLDSEKLKKAFNLSPESFSIKYENGFLNTLPIFPSTTQTHDHNHDHNHPSTRLDIIINKPNRREIDDFDSSGLSSILEDGVIIKRLRIPEAKRKEDLNDSGQEGFWDHFFWPIQFVPSNWKVHVWQKSLPI